MGTSPSSNIPVPTGLNFKFQFQFESSNGSINFPINLQNSSLGISASFVMSGTQKMSFGPCENLSDWNFKISLYFPLEVEILIWIFKVTNEVQSETSIIMLKLRIYKGTFDVF